MAVCKGAGATRPLRAHRGWVVRERVAGKWVDHPQVRLPDALAAVRKLRAETAVRLTVEARGLEDFEVDSLGGRDGREAGSLLEESRPARDRLLAELPIFWEKTAMIDPIRISHDHHLNSFSQTRMHLRFLTCSLSLIWTVGPINAQETSDYDLPETLRLISRKQVEVDLRDENGKLIPSFHEFFEEEIPLEPETQWPMERAPFEDLVVFPAVVESARQIDGSKWEIEFAVFPNFHSSPERTDCPLFSLPGEIKGGQVIERSLISHPKTRRVKLTGDGSAERFLAILKPGMVYGAGFANGSLQMLRVGEFYFLHTISACTQLSPPHFKKSGGRITFRFHANTLRNGDVAVEVTPDRIAGSDFTDYKIMSKLGTSDFHQKMEYQDLWSIEAWGDLRIDVIAPQIDGRGGSAMVELESISLKPSYEDDLKALGILSKKKPSPFVDPQATGWSSILKSSLGPVPKEQQVTASEQDSNF